MPEYHVAEQTFVDGIGRPFAMSWRVTEANAEAWISAADHTARDATNIGILFAKERGMTQGALTGQRVYLQYEPSTVAPIADDILRGNKLTVHYNADTHNYIVSISCRNPASYEQQVDSLVCALDAPTAMVDYITAIESFTLSPYGANLVVRQVKVVD